MHKEMDKEEMEEIVGEFEKLGIEKDKIDDLLVWGAKKTMTGMTKMYWSMKENGMNDEEAKKMLSKTVNKMMEMDFSAEIQEWEKDGKECHHHCHNNCK